MNRILYEIERRITKSYNYPSHKGIDLAWMYDDNGKYLDKENQVHPNCFGKVIYIEDGLGNGEGASGWGNYVLIKHPNGMYSRYAHLKKGIKVKVGQEVNEDSVLGYIGDSGIARGMHLHFEVQKNESIDSRIDPTPYLTKAICEDVKSVELKYKVGDIVVVNGYLHKNAYEGAERGMELTNFVSQITLVYNKSDGVYPYNIGKEYLGWVRESAITLYEEPKEETKEELSTINEEPKNSLFIIIKYIIELLKKICYNKGR